MKKEKLESVARKGTSLLQIYLELISNPKSQPKVIKGKEYNQLCREYGEAMEEEFGCCGVKKIPTTTDPITHKPIPYWPKVGAYA